MMESCYRSFCRSFQLPQAADPSKHAASFENRVLPVHVPKDGRTAQHQMPMRSGQATPQPKTWPQLLPKTNGQPK